MEKVIQLKNIYKSYHTEKEKIEILKDTSISFERGKLYAIMGHSGCGKTTLINILGLISDFEKGEYLLFNKNVNNLNDKELSYL